MDFKELKANFFLLIGLIFFSSLIIFEVPPRIRIYYDKYILKKNFKSYCKNIKLKKKNLNMVRVQILSLQE